MNDDLRLFLFLIAYVAMLGIMVDSTGIWKWLGIET